MTRTNLHIVILSVNQRISISPKYNKFRNLFFRRNRFAREDVPEKQDLIWHEFYWEPRKAISYFKRTLMNILSEGKLTTLSHYNHNGEEIKDLVKIGNPFTKN